MTASYKDMSDGSDIEMDDMKHVTVQKLAALKDTPIDVKREVILKDSQANREDEQDNSDSKSGGSRDKQGNSVIEIGNSRKCVVVYSANVNLSYDEQHELIEMKGNCTVIARALQILGTHQVFKILFGKENAREQPMLITKKLILLVVVCCIRKTRWYICIGRGKSIFGH